MINWKSFNIKILEKNNHGLWAEYKYNDHMFILITFE